jgi:hypothetical protein
MPVAVSAFETVRRHDGAKGCQTMKTISFISLCLAGALLHGCAESPSTIDGGAAEGDMGGAGELENGAPEAAPASFVDAKIATLAVPGGEIVFVDEGLTEAGGGIAFWELGDTGLSYLLDDSNATALEVFLALAPEGTPVPERLVEHHAEASRRAAGSAAAPRRLAVPPLLFGALAITNEGLNDGNSDADKDCWGWAGTSNPYASNYGYQGFDYLDFQANFNSEYSQIPSGAHVSGGVQQRQSNVPGVGGPTAAGHERAMAFCLSKAVKLATDQSLSESCSTNQGRVRVHVERTTDAAYSNWVAADSILLESFGQGGRFRSNYTNSGGGARKYMLFLEWQTVAAEGGSNNSLCADELAITWRSKLDTNAPGDVTF